MTRKAELEFGLSTRQLGLGTVVVSVLGDCDLTVAGGLESALAEAAESGAARVVVDLREATLVDSSALHALLAGRQRAVERQIDLAVACERPTVLQVLELTGIDQLIQVHPTLEQAMGGDARAGD